MEPELIFFLNVCPNYQLLKSEVAITHMMVSTIHSVTKKGTVQEAPLQSIQ